MLIDLMLSDDSSALTGQQEQDLLSLPFLMKQLDQSGSELSSKLLDSELYVISDPTANRIAHALRKEYAAEQSDASWQGDWLPNILGQCFPEEYAARFASLKPPILLYEPAPHLRVLVRESIRAFCLELPTATVAVARSLVEASVVDIAIKIGRVKDEATITEMRMCERISSLIDRRVSNSSPLRQSINRFMASASNIVHGDVAADMKEAHRLLEDAFNLMSQLYVSYRAQYPRK